MSDLRCPFCGSTEAYCEEWIDALECDNYDLVADAQLDVPQEDLPKESSSNGAETVQFKA